jgi:hypothetical protein
VSQASLDQLKLIDLRKPPLRLLLVVPVALVLLFSWYAIRWYTGDFVAEFAPQMEEGELEAAQAAVRLAPADPWTHWMVASLKKRSLLPGEMEEAVRQYEEAVRLSPNDYRFWVDLGRAREDMGDRAGGEKALRRAVELAPSYALPRWYLGNLLLRAGRVEDGFAELRRAAEADAKLRPQLFNAAWALYAQNIDEIKRVVGDSAAARAEFTIYLLGRQRLDDALGLWSSLKPAEKREQALAGDALMKSLVEQKRYKTALTLLNELSSGNNPTTIAQFVNGSFENDVETAGSSVFNWQIKSLPEAQIAIDGSTGHGGARSLRILFRATSTLAFDNVAQLVVVEPSTQYHFECFARATDLKSGAMPFIEIIDGMDGTTVLGASQQLAPGTYDWQPVTIDFKTPPKTEAIRVRIGRGTCGGDAVCPIFGMVWYDDFNLKITGGASGGQRDSHSGSKARL